MNRKRVQRLMRQMGLGGIAPGPRTSRAHPAHRVYPYLLRDVVVERPNQVWSTDITYIPMRTGFMFLVAILDWYSRYVLSWALEHARYRVLPGSAGGGFERRPARDRPAIAAWR